MDKNIFNEEESSLVEIEIAEQEEIEVEESETETENNKSNELQINSQKEEPNIIQNNSKNTNNNEKKEEEREENIDKDYSEIELKIIDIMNGSESIINLLNNNNKWDEKKKGFLLLKEFISKQINIDKIIKNFEVFFNYIQSILKNFKESNLILLKEGLECIYILFYILKKNKSDNILNKKYMNILIIELNEKIIETKLKSIYIKLIDILMNIYNPNEVINYLIQIIVKSNKISLLKEYSIFLKNYLYSNENNIKLLNVKDIIDFSIKLGNNNNKELRVLSIDIICLLYNYIGEDYLMYIKNNIKESIFKNIEQKIKQTNIKMEINKECNSINKNILEKNNSNEIKIENSYDINNSNKKENLNKIRVDISKYITPTLIKYINLGKWKEKKEAIEYIHKILNDNDNHILINGLQDLIDLIIDKLIDSNKNLVKLIIELLSHLINSLGVQLKPYTKNLISQLLTNLTDKNSMLRQECINCINKWISIIQNFDNIFILIPSFLINDNYEMRNELLKILINNLNIIKKESFYINHFSDIINSLLYCLQDKSSNIRNLTEEFIKATMKLIPREYYIKKISQFKPAISESLTNIINDIYNYKENYNEIFGKIGISIESNFTKKRINKFFSPNKNLRIDEEISSNAKKILYRTKLTKSLEKNLAKNAYFNNEMKNSQEIENKTENNKKKINEHKTCITTLNNLTKKNKMIISSSNSTAKNVNKKLKRIKFYNNDNTFTNNSNYNINNNSNNSEINLKSKNKLNNKKKNNILKKDEKNIENISSISNIAKRVNKYYNNSQKFREISNIKRQINSKNKNKNDKKNILNYKNNFNKFLNEIDNDENPKIQKRNRFFSPIVKSRENINKKDISKLNDDSFNNSENIFYKRLNSNRFNNKGSFKFTKSFNNTNKSENEIKRNIFNDNYKRKKEQKEKRIKEDLKNNYYFELHNFDKIPKIKDIMINIFSRDFVEKIFGDNISSIITSINKITNYIENDIKDNILNLADNLDILLKVIGYKLVINKSSSLVIETFKFLNSLLKSYKKYRIFINEIESNILLNIFIDKLIQKSNKIRDMANNLLWSVINMIGEELSLLKIIHLIEYKNNKTKNEAINVIIQLYNNLLKKGKYNFDNWKIKIIKNIISLYFEKDIFNKEKLLFIIKDLYSSFKNEIWKNCQNISSKNKDELIQKIEGNINNKMHNFDNDYQAYSNKNSDNKKICNYIFKNINKKNENKKNSKSKRKISKNQEISKFKNENLKKLKTNLIYNKKNIKVFENRKNIKLNHDESNNSIHIHKYSNLTDIKNNNIISNNNLKYDKNDLIECSDKYLNIRENSMKKNLFLKHINTTKNVHDNSNYENIINEATNKIALMNKNEEEDNLKKNMGKNKLSQSTVIINNNYNFIKIKNDKIKNKERELSNKKNYQQNNIINNDIKSNKNNTINVIKSKANNDIIKKKVIISKKEKFNEIKNILDNLCLGDKEDMTELILKIHNILYTNYKKNESLIILHCDYIFNKLIQALNNLLNEKKIYTNYIKYISNVLCKICKLSDLISKINIDTQNNLIILSIKIVSLLNDNENDNNNYYYNNTNDENNVIIKCFNSIMLRIIEYGDINNNINILMNFEKKYRNINNEIVSYVAKCLIIISEKIKKTFENINLGIVIENIYKLLEDFSNNKISIEIKNKTDKIILTNIKKILYQLIIYRGDKELIEYITNKNFKNKNQKFLFEYNNNIITNWLLNFINTKTNDINKLKNKNFTEMK